MKRIIIEGPDGSGKTTLIEKLCDDFHFLIKIVNEKQDKQDFDTWWPEVLSRNYMGVQVPIHDRFYYSELVYGPILRGSLAGSEQTHKDTRMSLRREAFLVYARPTLGSIMEDSKVHEQMEGVTDHLGELVEGYDQVMKAQPAFYGDRFMTYDYHFRSDYKKLTDRLEAYLLDY